MEGFGKPKEEVLSIEKFGEYEAEINGMIKERQRLALRIYVEEEKRLDIYGKFTEDIVTQKVFSRPNGLRDRAETAISCKRPGLIINRNRYTSVVGSRRAWMHMYARVAQQSRAGLTYE